MNVKGMRPIMFASKTLEKNTRKNGDECKSKGVTHVQDLCLPAKGRKQTQE